MTTEKNYLTLGGTTYELHEIDSTIATKGLSTDNTHIVQVDGKWYIGEAVAKEPIENVIFAFKSRKLTPEQEKEFIEEFYSKGKRGDFMPVSEPKEDYLSDDPKLKITHDNTVWLQADVDLLKKSFDVVLEKDKHGIPDLKPVSSVGGDYNGFYTYGEVIRYGETPSWKREWEEHLNPPKPEQDKGIEAQRKQALVKEWVNSGTGTTLADYEASLPKKEEGSNAPKVEEPKWKSECEILGFKDYVCVGSRNYAPIFTPDSDADTLCAYTVEELLERNTPISSVKRLSDGEILTVGKDYYDIDYKSCIKRRKIDDFCISETHGMYARVVVDNVETRHIHIDELKKHKSEPLIITEDGIAMFEKEQHVYWLDVYEWRVGGCSVGFAIEQSWHKPHCVVKVFASSEQREAYIEVNKPLIFTLGDLRTAIDEYRRTEKEYVGGNFSAKEIEVLVKKAVKFRENNLGTGARNSE